MESERKMVKWEHEKGLTDGNGERHADVLVVYEARIT